MFHQQRGFLINRSQTIAEDIVNTISHSIGLLLAIAGLVILDIYAGFTYDPYKIVSVTLFGVSLITMYCSSIFYHSVRSTSTLKKAFKVFDHIAIYLLIAGSYSPFLLVNLRDDWGWVLFVAIWSLAALGISFKCFYIHRFEALSLIFYLMMGWMVVVAVEPLFHHLALSGILWLLYGGLCYTIGAFFYAWESPLFSHAIWHLFVLAGTICHFFAILFYVVPY